MQVKPKLNALAEISASYPATETGASTPTHYALLELQKLIKASGPSKLGPTYVVLATDGKPNFCDFHDGMASSDATEQQARNTVAELAASGTKLFAISMAGNDAGLQAHLSDLATAGATGKGAFTPTSKDELAKALSSIIGQTASCDLSIEGRVQPGRECTGTVTLDGATLQCDGKDGYRLKEDRQTLELLGDACNQLRNKPSAKLVATFPCDHVVLL